MNLATFIPPPLCGAAVSDYPAFSDSIIFQLNGAFVVFAALGMIWGLLEVTGFFFKRAALATKAAAPTPAPVAMPTPVAAAPVSAEIAPELIAVISAAVAVTLGADARVTSVVEAQAPLQDWAREGRRQIHSARRVR